VQERLSTALEGALMALLMRLPEPSTEQAFALYEREAVRLVGGAQRRSATFAMAYVAQLSPPSPVLEPPTADRALEGVAVTAASPVARSPVLRLLARLKDGDDESVARRAAGSYAGELGTGDVQAAERGGLDEAARVGTRRLVGWRKELSPEPCEWCVMIASGGGRYRRADTVPFHPRDHCSVAPVFADE
jgi:hypothetical protein